MMLRPWFLAALAVLAVNDHVLKGAGLLPVELTGKLSDFAGLLVAPAVLAWLLSAVRPRALIACHIAVALVFSALEIAPIAQRFNELGLGHAWADPSDLIALPMLGVSYALMRTRRASPRFALERVAGAFALLICAASMPTSPAPRYPYPPAGILAADLVVRHVGSEDLRISVQRLRDESHVDCDALLASPSSALTGLTFREPEDWTLARGDAVPLWDRRGGAIDRACYAVRLTSRGVAYYVVWRHDAPAVRDVDIRLDPGQPAEPEALVLADDPQALPDTPEGAVAQRAP